MLTNDAHFPTIGMEEQVDNRFRNPGVELEFYGDSRFHIEKIDDLGTTSVGLDSD